MIVALFDSDGTLYTGQFGRGMMKYSTEHYRRYFAWRYYASILPAFAVYKVKLGSWQNLQHALLANLSGMLQGLDESQAKAALTWLVTEYLLPTQRADVFKRLKDHQAQGHKVIIVSGMLTPSAEILKEFLGAEAALGTQTEFVNGKYSGRTIQPLMSGATKASKVQELVQSRGWDVDWSASFAYGDSFTDSYMMSLVGHSVAVYPDAKLHALAQEKNWEVLGTPKD